MCDYTRPARCTQRIIVRLCPRLQVTFVLQRQIIVCRAAQYKHTESPLSQYGLHPLCACQVGQTLTSQLSQSATTHLPLQQTAFTSDGLRNAISGLPFASPLRLSGLFLPLEVARCTYTMSPSIVAICWPHCLSASDYLLAGSMVTCWSHSSIGHPLSVPSIVHPLSVSGPTAAP